jgi:hypothetical protein
MHRSTHRLTAIALLAATPSLATLPSPTELFHSLKAGQWVQAEGVPQKDQSVLCSEVKILTGDFLEDEWGASGIVRSVDPQKHLVRVHRLAIRPRDQVEYQVLKGFSDIKPGVLIDAEGTYMKNGTFLAKELEDESEKLKRKPEWQNKVQFIGRIEKLDSVRRTIVLMGCDFVITDRTRVKSVLK